MSKQSKTMPKIDLKVYVRLVAAVFMISAGTAFTFVLIRLWHPHLFYQDMSILKGSNLVIHFVISGLMVVGSVVGFVNSCVVLNRPSERNSGQNITTWLLLDSVFEASRIFYVFVCKVVLECNTRWQLYEIIITTAQYLLDSFLYFQMVLSH